VMMRKPIESVLIAVAILGILPPPAAVGDALAVTLDGRFRDWSGVAVAVTDPAGDGRDGSVDLRRLWLVNDGEALYLRLNVGRAVILQNPPEAALGHRLRLYLDTDAELATGKPVGRLGVEIEVRFGEREVVIYDAAGIGETLTPGRSGAMGFPTHSSRAFEIRVPLTMAGPEISSAQSGPTIRLLLRDEGPGGDRLPDRGLVSYRVSRQPIAAPDAIEIDRRSEDDVRLLSLNVHSGIVTEKALYQRYLQALDPDLLVFQELGAWDAERTRLYLDHVLPRPRGARWWAVQVADCVTASAYPVLAAAAVDGNLVVYVDLPDERTSRDLVLFNVHLPCCEDDAGRDRESDQLARTWRDLLEGAGPFVIDPQAAMIIAGDFNFVGFRRQLRAVRDGIFIDDSLGPDFSPGRELGSLATAPLRHTHAPVIYTWRSDDSPFAPGKLDFLFFTSDVARLRKSFVLDTATLPVAELKRRRLRRADSLLASDHLPLVADFVFQSEP